ncbi:NUDIX hydrolase [Gaetbulibacter aestuarii]|uniref:NUDIX domain-containing protein n=1 Tax=Gaetbulibacter aestuarii TaxID=1502358 RepID=A0ABW7N4I5_9FLAO
MTFKALLEKRSIEAWEIYLPHLSIDCVVFGFHEGALKVLLLKMKESDSWGLPGGYILKDENLKIAANRILEARTGATNIYLQQFRVFGETHRSEAAFDYLPDDSFFKQRFISIGFYALVDFTEVEPVVDELSTDCGWRDINRLPELMMDHQFIFDKALETLRKQLIHKPIGYNLLPEKFTMPELQRLYEIILDKKLNRGNFYRKILRYDILIKLDETRKGGAHKAPDLYSFDQEKYKAALKNGLNEIW